MLTIIRSTVFPAILLSTALWATPGLAQVCTDSDGDGWGWDGTASCRVSTVAQSACDDPDGDGYGWDGQATCIAGQAAQAASPAAPVVVPGSQCVDDDGDGWGWNGVASCRTDDATSGQGTTPPVGNSSPVSTGGTGLSGSFDRQRDLIAIHFDHAPDRDDGHASVAALMMTEKLSLNVQVVGGTYGVYSRDRYDAESESVMNAVWGSDWLNAHSNHQGAVNAAVNRWTATLAAGGSVWVAEGGPSDFTAEVVQRINQLHSEFDTSRRIRVIQHSVWNEDHSLASALDYTRANTRYVRIEDGNNPNATADLRFESHNNGSFVSRAQSSRYSAEWTSAFRYLSPSEKLDFSDTVELLHIVGLGTNVVADVNQFGDYFF